VLRAGRLDCARGGPGAARSLRWHVAAALCGPGGREGGQVAVPDGWHAGVELPGLAEDLLGSLVVPLGVCCPGIENQPPGRDLLPVLLPQPGPGRVERGGLLGELPGLVQVPGLVCLVGGRRGAVGLHPGVSC